MRNFDGRGNIAFIDYVASLTPGRVPPGGIDLNPVFRSGLTGSYHMNADCTGTAAPRNSISLLRRARRRAR